MLGMSLKVGDFCCGRKWICEVFWGIYFDRGCGFFLIFVDDVLLLLWYGLLEDFIDSVKVLYMGKYGSLGMLVEVCGWCWDCGLFLKEIWFFMGLFNFWIVLMFFFVRWVKDFFFNCFLDILVGSDLVGVFVFWFLNKVSRDILVGVVVLW